MKEESFSVGVSHCRGRLGRRCCDFGGQLTAHQSPRANRNCGYHKSVVDFLGDFALLCRYGAAYKDESASVPALYVGWDGCAACGTFRQETPCCRHSASSKSRCTNDPCYTSGRCGLRRIFRRISSWSSGTLCLLLHCS